MVNLILRRLFINFRRNYCTKKYGRCSGLFYIHNYVNNTLNNNSSLNNTTICKYTTNNKDKTNNNTLTETVQNENLKKQDTTETSTSETSKSKESSDKNNSDSNKNNSDSNKNNSDSNKNNLDSNKNNLDSNKTKEENSESEKNEGKDDEKKFRFLPFGIYGGATLVFSGFALSYYIDRGQDLKDVKLSQLLDDLTQYMYDRIEELFPTDNSPLLPDFDELKYPPNLPTLVLDLDKVIAKMEYDRKLGWRVKKRPYADKFFKELINYYEIVIWSDDSYPVAYDIANLWGLPVIGCIHRDHCKKYKGGYIKDLSRLGRDLKRVILIDHDKIACTLQQDNSILIKEFDGDENDEELLYLINLLKTIAINPQDVKLQIKQLGGGQDYLLGRRFTEQFSQTQEKAKSRMNMTKMLGFKH